MNERMNIQVKISKKVLEINTLIYSYQFIPSTKTGYTEVVQVPTLASSQPHAMQCRQNISENRRRTYSTHTAFLVYQRETGIHRQDRHHSPYITPTRAVVRAYSALPTFDGTLRRNTPRTHN